MWGSDFHLLDGTFGGIALGTLRLHRANQGQASKEGEYSATARPPPPRNYPDHTRPLGRRMVRTARRPSTSRPGSRLAEALWAPKEQTQELALGAGSIEPPVEVGEVEMEVVPPDWATDPPLAVGEVEVEVVPPDWATDPPLEVGELDPPVPLVETAPPEDVGVLTPASGTTGTVIFTVRVGPICITYATN